MSVSEKNEIGYIRSDNRTYEKNMEKLLKFFRKILIRVECETVENGKIIVIPNYKRYNQIIITNGLKVLRCISSRTGTSCIVVNTIPFRSIPSHSVVS